MKIPIKLQEKIKENVFNHLKNSRADVMSIGLRIKHIEMMLKLAHKENILDDSLFLAIMFHDVCKYEEDGFTDHSSLSEKYLLNFYKNDKDLQKAINSNKMANILIAVERQSSKENYIFHQPDIKILMELDILSKFTEDYNFLYYTMTGIDKSEFFLSRLNKLINKINKIKAYSKRKIILEDLYQSIIQEHIEILHEIYKK